MSKRYFCAAGDSRRYQSMGQEGRVGTEVLRVAIGLSEDERETEGANLVEHEREPLVHHHMPCTYPRTSSSTGLLGTQTGCACQAQEIRWGCYTNYGCRLLSLSVDLLPFPLDVRCLHRLAGHAECRVSSRKKLFATKVKRSQTTILQ